MTPVTRGNISPVAERTGGGLQNLIRRFESDRGVNVIFIT